VVADGAMGTMLQAAELSLDDFEGLEGCNEILNVTRPDVVRGIHDAYLAVGCDAVETNTFGANFANLTEYGIADRISELAEAGARLAREVADGYSTADRPRWVIGSVGPGTKLPTLGHAPYATLRDAYQEEVTGLLAGGADVVLVETSQDLLQTKSAVVGARRAMTAAGRQVPLIAQVTVETTGTMLLGSEIAALTALEPLGIDLIGLNCATGPTEMSEHLRFLSRHARIPLSVMPNAGLPELGPTGATYPLTPQELAAALSSFVREYGTRLVGGCCGTTPPHTAAMRETLDRLVPGTRRREPRVVVPRPSAIEAPGVAHAPRPTLLQRRLEAGDFVVTVELDPPRGHTVDKLVQGAKLLKEKGVEIVDINDGSLGRVRMSVLATALLVRDGTGLDVNMHFTCRDRNLMGIQGDLLGAHALDIRNILAMTGDPPRAGDYANATAVFDVDGVGLIEILRRMNEGVDATGSSIGEPTFFCVGAAVNPAADDVEREIDRMHRKIQAGARWLQTQPVYDLEQLDRFLARAGGSPVPVLVGVLPLHSSRHAEFLHNEVPGITIPDAVRARMRQAGESALRAGIEMAQRLVNEVRGRYAGAYLMPSFGRFEVVAEVLDVLH
jgi:methionine synthase / methylenetetrahydrofolate reductase (NADH)